MKKFIVKVFSRKVLVLFFFYVFVFCSIGNAIWASSGDDYRGIVVNPSIEHINISKGQKKVGEVRLTHDLESNSDIILYPSARLFRQYEETGTPQFYVADDLGSSANASKWITFDEPSYLIKNGETVVCTYTINVDENAEPGGHYVGLVFSQVSDGLSNVALNKEVVDLLLISVEGQVVERGELVDFKSYIIEKNNFIKDVNQFVFLPVNFSIRYKNTGNVHTQIGGNIFIHRGDITKPIATLTVNPEVGYTLPGSIRNYSVVWSNGFVRYEYGKLKFYFDQFPKLPFGKYKATLMLRSTLDGNRVTTQREISFIVIPWPVIVFLVLLVVAISVVILSIRGFSRNQKKN